LVYERKKLIGEIENELGRANDVAYPVREIIATWRMPDSKGRLAGFAQVVYRYLEDEIDYGAPC
jgi:hypothetical protein